MKRFILIIIFCFCFISVYLIASNDNDKNNKNKNKRERDSTVLLYEKANELKYIRFSEDSLFTPEQMREDLLFFYDKILRTHPNPYHVISKDSLDKKVQDLLIDLNRPMNRREFWLKIATFNSYFDAHTCCFRIKEIIDYHNENSKPRITKNIANNLLMLDSLGNMCFNYGYNDSLLAGKQIKSVNGISATQIIDIISKYYSHENKNRESILFSSNFLLLFANIFGVVDSLQIEYVKNGNDIDVHTFYSKTSSNNTTTNQPKQQDTYKNIWEGKNFVRFNFYEKDSIAIIELNTFDYLHLGDNYRKDLEKIMDVVVKKNIKHLFIDISANGGGGDYYAVEILNFIKTKKKKYYNGSAEIRISPAYREFMGRMYGEKPSLFEKIFDKYYRQTFKTPTDSIIRDDYYWKKNNSKIQYTQNLYLIQSVMATASASTTLSSLVKTYKFGTIIGEETAGLTGCYINGVNFAMPNTSIPFMCSMKRATDVGGAMDGRGVLPDIEYKIENPYNSFTLEQLKEMLQLVDKHKGK